MSSVSNTLWYCKNGDILESYMMLNNSSAVSFCNSMMLPILPTNSGISPYLIKWSVVIVFCGIDELPWCINPTPASCDLMVSMPTNALEQMNSMLDVSTSMDSPCGCFLLRFICTFNLVPSIIFKSACCTPSPDTSLVIETFSDFRATLSISSKNTMPRCALSISPSADSTRLAITVSTSSPT